jgi:hypothetical protein
MVFSRACKLQPHTELSNKKPLDRAVLWGWARAQSPVHGPPVATMIRKSDSAALRLITTLIHLALWAQLGVFTRVFLDKFLTLGCSGGWGPCLGGARSSRSAALLPSPPPAAVPRAVPHSSTEVPICPLQPAYISRIFPPTCWAAS